MATPAQFVALTGGNGGFNPLSISGLQVWYDFSDPSKLWKDTARTLPVTADGDVIKGVTDKSGNAYHLAEATNGPAYKPGIKNGRSIARFDGINDTLLATIVSQAQPATVYVVSFANDTAGVKEPFTCTSWVIAYTAAEVVQAYSGVAARNYSVAQVAIWNVLSVVFNDPTETRIGVNGTEETFASAGASASGTALRIGSEAGAGFMSGDIGDALMYAGAHTLAQRQTVVRGFGNKWGIGVA